MIIWKLMKIIPDGSAVFILQRLMQRKDFKKAGYMLQKQMESWQGV